MIYLDTNFGLSSERLKSQTLTKYGHLLLEINNKKSDKVNKSVESKC